MSRPSEWVGIPSGLVKVPGTGLLVLQWTGRAWVPGGSSHVASAAYTLAAGWSAALGPLWLQLVQLKEFSATVFRRKSPCKQTQSIFLPQIVTLSSAL